MGAAPDERLKGSTEIQGNILAGFNKPVQLFLFLNFKHNQKGARAWLRRLTGDQRIATTRDVAAHNREYRDLRKAIRRPATPAGAAGQAGVDGRGPDLLGTGDTASRARGRAGGLRRVLARPAERGQGRAGDLAGPGRTGRRRAEERPERLGCRRTGPGPRRRAGDHRGRRRGQAPPADERRAGPREAVRSGVAGGPTARREHHAGAVRPDLAAAGRRKRGSRALRVQGRRLPAQRPRLHRGGVPEQALGERPQAGLADHRHRGVRARVSGGARILPAYPPARSRLRGCGTGRSRSSSA